MEREPTTRSLGDGRGQPQERLQNQEDIQETGEEEGYRLPMPNNGVRKVRECDPPSGVLGIPVGVATAVPCLIQSR